jgi:hypothetical protein
MISAWTKNAKTQEEKEAFQKEVLGSKRVLNRLQVLLDEMKADVDTVELNTKIYDIPNWDYRQADMNGYKRCLKQISKLINLDQGNND